MQDRRAKLLLNENFGIDRLVQAASKLAWEKEQIRFHLCYAQADRRFFEGMQDDGPTCLWIIPPRRPDFQERASTNTSHWHRGLWRGE
ncbi:hypothetical protein PspLS_10388 [Pyricularia sp. CBS 133598]|nr:hypothetical protein PspLS_10388 [Pyricularia sp. CBS 133598]